MSRDRVRYCLDGDAAETLLIEQGGTAVIEPEVPHHVELLDEDSAFLVEFHRGAMSNRVGLASDLVGITSRPHSSMSSRQGIPRCMIRDPHPKAPGRIWPASPSR